MNLRSLEMPGLFCQLPQRPFLTTVLWVAGSLSGRNGFDLIINATKMALYHAKEFLSIVME